MSEMHWARGKMRIPPSKSSKNLFLLLCKNSVIVSWNVRKTHIFFNLGKRKLTQENSKLNKKQYPFWIKKPKSEIWCWKVCVKIPGHFSVWSFFLAQPVDHILCSSLPAWWAGENFINEQLGFLRDIVRPSC